MIYEQLLVTNAIGRAQSEEAEMITAEQKIGEKVLSGGKPTKFPRPAGAFHAIMADMRGYLDSGGDIFDYRQMAYGAAGIPARNEWMIHFWEVEPGRLEPIAGLFEESNRLRASHFIRDRIHFLGFVNEKEYRKGEIRERAYYLANPNLFATDAEARAAFQTYALRPIDQ